jgi:predicted ATPase/DNA-binding SARP family transcriptional activator
VCILDSDCTPRCVWGAHANELVGTEALVDQLFGSERSGSAVNAVRVAVSRLRRVLEGGDERGAIETRPGGYMLNAEAEQLDAALFERRLREGRGLLAAGDAATAAARLREALTLWRGAPLADVALVEYLQPEIRRLEELRLLALIERIDADLTLGAGAELIEELEPLVAANPLQERLRGQLMLALYRAGRQADALAVYRETSELLRHELGLEPSRRLQELERSILQHDTSLDRVPRAPSPPASTGNLAALRDVPSPRRIFHLRIDDGGSDCFPAPRALQPGQTNLPEEISSFIGRERELVELRELLGMSRMVTLTGAGGVGKTRLAQRFAGAVVGDPADGVWFVDLAPVADPAHVAATVAGVLDVAERADREMVATLVDALADRELLIVLDNSEHVLETAVPLAAQLLGGCPGLSVVATSRQALAIPGEWVYRVPSLSTPDVNIEDPERVVQTEAVRLFVDRAEHQGPGLVLNCEDVQLVGRICRRLDGIPLAIELAAVRVRSMSIRDLDARLDQRFTLLTAGSSRTALPRQQTLAALLDWSYQLLSEAECNLLEQLSVFAPNGFDLDAAEAVCSKSRIDRVGVLNHLDALVDKSLVQAEGSWHAMRYRLLETVREYAAGKLRDRGPRAAPAGRRAHRDHYLQLAMAAQPHLLGPDARDWLDRLDAEHANLRAALDECLRDPDPEHGLRLVAILGEFWRARDHAIEGTRTLTRQLERPEARMPTLSRGYALAARSRLLTLALSEYRAGIADAEEALEIAKAEHDDRLAALGLGILAWARVRQGEFIQSLELNRAGTALAQSLGDPFIEARFAVARGVALASLGQDGRVAFEDALRLSRHNEDQSQTAFVLGNLGYLDLNLGDLGSARARIEEAIRLFREHNDQFEVASWSMNLGLVYYLENDQLTSKRLFVDAIQVIRRGGNVELLGLALLGMALTAQNADTSATLHGAADALTERHEDPLISAEARLRESDRNRLRQTLGETRFESAYQVGAQLSATDAITLALSH